MSRPNHLVSNSRDFLIFNRKSHEHKSIRGSNFGREGVLDTAVGLILLGLESGITIDFLLLFPTVLMATNPRPT